MERRNIPFITFYSYKGGSGRTVCAANTLGALGEKLGASGESPLLVADMDIDSAGLSKWLCKELGKAKSFVPGITVSKILNRENSLVGKDKARFLEALIDISAVVSPTLEEGSVVLLPGEFKGRGRSVAPEAGKAIKNRIRGMPFCGVILDSASGRQDIARWCQLYSDLIVYCSRLSIQHVAGTDYDIDRIKRSYEEYPDDTCPPLVVAPVAVPREDDTRKELREMRDEQLRDLRRTLGTDHAGFLEGGIPEVERFKFGECVLSTRREKFADERSALEAYDRLAALIADNLRGS